MSYNLEYETLLSIIPSKEISRFKGILAGYKTLRLEDKRQDEWTYFEGWDHVMYDCKRKYRGLASDFTKNLSDKMFIYENLVVFVEHKGVGGWCNPVVTLLSLDKGFVVFNDGK